MAKKKQYKRKKGPQPPAKTIPKNFRVTVKTNLLLQDKAKQYFKGNESKFLRMAIHNYKPKKKTKL